MTEWPIREIARRTGLTSRTLRHYEQIGLLHPARVAHNGYRFYGSTELARLYRILALRELGLPLATIQRSLTDEAQLPQAIADHLRQLDTQLTQLQQRIQTVQHTLHTLHTRENGTPLNIEEIFAGFDHTAHEAEARERWGSAAIDRSTQRRNALSDGERRAADAHSLDVNRALRDAADAGLAPASPAVQRLVTQHYRWITTQWGGTPATADAYEGLGDLYVADPRFAATYGGVRNAEQIRAAMRVWSAAHLRQS